MKKLLLKVGSFSSLEGQPENLLTVVSELCQKQREGGGGETDLGETSDFCCALFGHRLFRLVNFLKRIQTFLLQNEHQF